MRPAAQNSPARRHRQSRRFRARRRRGADLRAACDGAPAPPRMPPLFEGRESLAARSEPNARPPRGEGGGCRSALIMRASPALRAECDEIHLLVRLLLAFDLEEREGAQGLRARARTQGAK